MGIKDDQSGKSGRLLTLREVAELLNVSIRTVYRLVAGGVLPAPVKIGRSTRFRPDDVERCVERCRGAGR